MLGKTFLISKLQICVIKGQFYPQKITQQYVFHFYSFLDVTNTHNKQSGMTSRY